MTNAPVLIVDDDAGSRRSLQLVLEREGYLVMKASDGFSALAAIEAKTPALVISDLAMPGMSGLDLLKRLRECDPQSAVVIVTAHGDVDSAVEAMREGALDYLSKPVDVERLLKVVAQACRQFELRRTSAAHGRSGDGTSRIIGSSSEMHKVFASIARAAPSRATVLITGESGTGKELVAEAIHRGSPRASGPFVRLNCAALSESLLESELFGHERGSFTGADKRRCGRIEQANGGTLFLDEIGEISPSLQVKLLRVLQERALERVGGNDTIQVDVRFVAATNRDLQQLVAEGRFREDLYYRLNVVALQLPALRDRPSDIPKLAEHFLRKHSSGHAVEGFSPDALQLLVDCDWPGNVRQLENAIERASVFAGGRSIEPNDLPAELRGGTKSDFPTLPGASMEDLERYAILKTMEAVGGSTRRTAALLGISVRTIQYRLRHYGAASISKAPSVRPTRAA